MKTQIPFKKYLEDSTIEHLMQHNLTKMEFVKSIREFASIGYMVPLVVLQYCWSR